MKVQVIVAIDGSKETSLVGEAAVFGSVDYTRGDDKRLRDIGFYLTDWSYAGHGGAHHKGWCFIPWGSAFPSLKRDRPDKLFSGNNSCGFLTKNRSKGVRCEKKNRC